MLKKIRSLVFNSNPSYIECYDDALTNEECRILISLFEKGRKTPGKSMRDGERVVDNDRKKSIELDAPNNIYDGSVLSAIVYQALAPCINKYLEKYDNLKDFVEDVSKEPLEYEPGSMYVYGINQAILGRIVEVVTKKSFYEYLKERIFDPLNMVHTKFYLTAEERERFQPLFLNSQSIKEFTNSYDELHYQIDNHAYFGGEGLVSTLEDYAKFCKMLLNDGELNGNRIISQSSIDLMTEKHSEGTDGFYNAFSLFVLEDPEEDGRNSSKGIYGWSGYHNTHFWIDNEKNLFGLFMTRAREYSQDIQNDFREAVYSIY